MTCLAIGFHRRLFMLAHLGDGDFSYVGTLGVITVTAGMLAPCHVYSEAVFYSEKRILRLMI